MTFIHFFRISIVICLEEMFFLPNFFWKMHFCKVSLICSNNGFFTFLSNFDGSFFTALFRWTKAAKNYHQIFINLHGDILLSAGIITYLGPFTAVYREEVVQTWQLECRGHGLPCTADYDVKNTLGDPITIRSWNINGLPTDHFSVQNGVMVHNSRRWLVLAQLNLVIFCPYFV